MEIHGIVKKLREEKGFSQEYIANQLGLSQSQYCRREKGMVKFLADEIFKLSQIFEVPINSLFNVDRVPSLPDDQKDTLSDKLIEQYEIRLKEKDELITFLRNGVQE
jgi:transcriptional regulator with XRE-family HTH domain